MMDLVGRKWKELNEDTQKTLLENANAIDGVTGNNMEEDGECIIDLTEQYSVPGRINNGKVEVSAESVIYNPAE